MHIGLAQFRVRGGLYQRAQKLESIRIAQLTAALGEPSEPELGKG